MNVETIELILCHQEGADSRHTVTHTYKLHKKIDDPLEKKHLIIGE